MEGKKGRKTNRVSPMSLANTQLGGGQGGHNEDRA